MFNIKRKNKNEETIYSPAIGKVIPISEVNDAMFADKLLGDGVGIILEDDLLCSPCDGIISMIAVTKHAIGITSTIGAEIILHVGLDTVNLNGKGFEVLVKENQKVKVGDPILKVDRVFMESKNIDLTTPMIVTNCLSFNVSIVQDKKKITYKDELLTILK